MAIQHGDFTISLTTENLNNALIGVIGREFDVKLKFSNNSLTDALYNLGITLKLPDGLSYVSSSVIPNSNTIDNSFFNIIEFINIKDLYSNELNYEIELTLKLNEYYRSNSNINVDFGIDISDISFSAIMDTMPRGYLDNGNQHITATASAILKTFRYYIKFIGPTKFIKGAGKSLNETPTTENIFNYELEVNTNTREDSIADIEINLANGVRYLNNINITGANSDNFPPANIISINPSKNNYTITFKDVFLSKDSTNKINFDAAIWDKLTENGIENFGEEISNGTTLTSVASIGFESEFIYSYSSTSAYALLIMKLLLSAVTDVNTTNSFIIEYSTGTYTEAKNIILENIVPDGTEFISSSINPNNIINNLDGTTTLRWELASIPLQTNGSITFETLTKDSYINNTPVYSNDELLSALNVSFNTEFSSTILLETLTKTLLVKSPVITKTTKGYYYSDLAKKDINVATKDDYVLFNITYDKTNVNALQKEPIIYDYPPFNFELLDAPTLITNASFPNYQVSLVPSNGFAIEFLEPIVDDILTFDFYLKNSNISESSSSNNLAKLNILNSSNKAFSIPTTSIINFGLPNLKYSDSISSNNCIGNNSSFLYTLNILNQKSNDIDFLVDVFNSVSTTNFDGNLLNIIDIQVYGNADYEPISLTSNSATLSINRLPADEYLKINFIFNVISSPVNNSSTQIKSTLTYGTIQEDINSDTYPNSDITKNKTLNSCNIEITKTLIPNTVNPGEPIVIRNTITKPGGTICYNLKLEETLFDNASDYISNVRVNGEIKSYQIENNKLLISISDFLSSNESFIVSYETKAYGDNSILEENIEQSSTLIWTNEHQTTTYSESISDTLTLLKPKLFVEYKQQNINKKTDFLDTLLNSNIGDYINNKIKISNIGTSDAIAINSSLKLNENIQFIESYSPYLIYNSTEHSIDVYPPLLPSNYGFEFIFKTKLLTLNKTILDMNSVSTSYKAYINDNIYDTVNSNILYITGIDITLEKSQRNITLNTEFTTNNISVIKNQNVQFKITFTNNTPYSLNNIKIFDSLPIGTEFLGFESFSNGILEIHGTNIEGTISSLPTGQSLEIIYTAKVPIDSLKRVKSNATSTFNMLISTKTLTLLSNSLFTTFTSLGRGFCVY